MSKPPNKLPAIVTAYTRARSAVDSIVGSHDIEAALEEPVEVDDRGDDIIKIMDPPVPSMHQLNIRSDENTLRDPPATTSIQLDQPPAAPSSTTFVSQVKFIKLNVAANN